MRPTERDASGLIGADTAVPDYLRAYSLVTAGKPADDDPSIDHSIRALAGPLGQALAAYRSSKPAYGKIPEDLEARLTAYASLCQTKDSWVGDVASAFEMAGKAGAKRSGPEGFLSVASSTIAENVLKAMQADQAAIRQAAAYLSLDLKAAMDTGDTNKILTDLDKLRQNQWDPIYTSAFYQTPGGIGPKELLNLVRQLRGSRRWDDIALLSNSFGRATRAPDWSPQSNDNFAQQVRGHLDQTVDLLRYGTFSQDFLTKTGDKLVMFIVNTYLLGSGGNLDRDASGKYDQQFEVFLHALARNPDAAASFLLGKYLVSPPNYHPAGGYPNNFDKTRLQMLIEWGGGWKGGETYPGDGGTALGHAIYAAGAESSAAGQNATKLYQVIIHNVPDPEGIQEGIMDGVTRLVSRRIGDFSGQDAKASPMVVPQKDASGLSEVERRQLFDLIVDSGEHLVELRRAAQQWAASHQHASGELDAWGAYYGQLAGLIDGPAIYKVKANADRNMAIHDDLLNGLVSLVGLEPHLAVPATLVSLLMATANLPSGHPSGDDDKILKKQRDVEVNSWKPAILFLAGTLAKTGHLGYLENGKVLVAKSPEEINQALDTPREYFLIGPDGQLSAVSLERAMERLTLFYKDAAEQ